MPHPMKADVSIAHVLPPPGSHRLLIKNMVCPQCIRVVREELTALGLTVHRVALGEADVSTADGAAPDWAAIRASLQEAGFELLEDPRDQLVDRIKTLLVALIHYPPPGPRLLNYSDYLVEHLSKDYHYLSHLFSASEGLTIEKFIIRQKVERAKELIGYGELPMAEVAQQLGYSSPAHLSRQFRQVTGLTPTEFQRLGPASHARRSLDSLI
ncbi:AraC family transcriptional regulator [Hymenobacter sp. GOD-10R]|jgi:AraC-like DNA-binding protein|uniref:helix-turn-helix domain-containing protein n=1 Tax=Hymenobacter sp. GOD-10R TaxID=3093922 RepID=UPI002D78E4A0|nr:AraC family transcriptional regulator [Hymenobacter sp. GOD-10R]WRQ31494.1 AraC family transcriptional regulator [Hymenobacter sp. GOD-10R]